MDATTTHDHAAGRGPRMRGIARAAGRSCSRPGCGTPAAATLVFSYGDRTAHLVELLDERDPQAYDLCDPHAARTRAPMRWELVDDRPARPPLPDRGWDDGDGTVAVLAAALRGDGRAVVDADADAVAVADELLDPDDDPLRAALEEVQRVVEPDPTDSAPSVPPTPLRRRRVVIVHPDDPDDEPVLW